MLRFKPARLQPGRGAGWRGDIRSCDRNRLERARGLRARYETAKGFSVSATKTVNVPVEKLYDA